jgi:hypothetical protein
MCRMAKKKNENSNTGILKVIISGWKPEVDL